MREITKSSKWGNEGQVDEGMVWKKYEPEGKCLKGLYQRKYHTDSTCAGATEKLAVRSEGIVEVSSRGLGLGEDLVGSCHGGGCHGTGCLFDRECNRNAPLTTLLHRDMVFSLSDSASMFQISNFDRRMR